MNKKTKRAVAFCATALFSIIVVFGLSFVTARANVGGDAETIAAEDAATESPDAAADTETPEMVQTPEPTDTSEPAETPAPTAEPTETLSVKSVWSEGDTLHIQVTDVRTGVDQTLSLDMREYAGSGEEYIAIQAIDRAGNKSGTVLFKNPYYVAAAETDAPPTPAPGQSASAIDGETETPEPASAANPFTPDGTGGVVDDVHEGDGKEFFSIKTEDGNVFYLIVDRQRNSDNVYLLNAVTENDLTSLAKPGNGKAGSESASGIPAASTGQTSQSGQFGEPQEGGQPAQTLQTGETDQPSQTGQSDQSEQNTQASESPQETADPDAQNPEANAEETKDGKSNGRMSLGAMIFIGVAALAVGGVGYYFKIVKPKKKSADEDEEDFADDFDDDTDGDSDDDGADGLGEDSDVEAAIGGDEVDETRVDGGDSE